MQRARAYGKAFTYSEIACSIGSNNSGFHFSGFNLCNECSTRMKLLFLLILGLICTPIAWGQNKSKKPKVTKSTLEDVSGEALNEVLEDNDEVLVLFYEDNKSPQVKKLITTLEKFDLSDLGDVQFVRCSDPEEAEEFGIQQNELPKIVLFDNSVPDEYSGDILDIKSKF